MRIVTILSFLAFLSFLFVDIFIIKVPELWFYAFCLAVSLMELPKGFLFVHDSAVYLGFLTLFVGTSGFLIWQTQLHSFTLFFILFSFVLASFFTAIITKENFHFIISFSTFFVTIYVLLFAKNLITLPIFIAFVVSFLLLLCMEMLFALKRRE